MTELEEAVEKRKEKIRTREPFVFKRESRIEKPTPRKRRVSKKVFHI